MKGLILTAISFLFATWTNISSANDGLWEVVADDLPMPYGVIAVNDKLYVSTVPDIVEVDEISGTFTSMKRLQEASPSGMLLDRDRSILAIENGAGTLLGLTATLAWSTSVRRD